MELVLVVNSQVHLGSLVTNNQHISKEMGRRLSTTGATMRKLQDLWKLGVTNAVITSQVLYSLDTTRLLKRDLKRLSAAQALMIALDYVRPLCLLQQNCR